ncbi:MAG: hypothetical protein ACXVZX_02245 [Terriglobales bacterium]
MAQNFTEKLSAGFKKSAEIGIRKFSYHKQWQHQRRCAGMAEAIEIDDTPLSANLSA